MSRSIAVISVGVAVAILVGGPALVLTRSASAMSAADRAARKHAAATCRTQIKEQGHYKEMSWYARHKAVKACVKDALAKQHCVPALSLQPRRPHRATAALVALRAGNGPRV